jgi:predicted enzyme related to lactoylglutathione lyase
MSNQQPCALACDPAAEFEAAPSAGPSDRLDTAREFYADLLGWSSEVVPGPIPRTSFTLGDLLLGGAHSPTPQEGNNARWTVSFRVAEVDEAVVRAKELDGAILVPPMYIPIGRFGIAADPAGAAFTMTAFPAGPFRGVDGS